jgi:hypothetical protein
MKKYFKVFFACLIYPLTWANVTKVMNQLYVVCSVLFSLLSVRSTSTTRHPAIRLNRNSAYVRDRVAVVT